jgi:hypothetical protein
LFILYVYFKAGRITLSVLYYQISASIRFVVLTVFKGEVGAVGAIRGLFECC